MAAIKPIIQAFAALPTPVKTAIVAFLALAAAIGPVVWIFGTGISVIGSVIGMLGSLGGIMATITAAAPVLGAAFTVMTGPIGLIVVAIAAAIAAGIAIIKNWGKIKKAIANFDLSEFASKLTKFILEIPGRIFVLGIEIMKGLAKGIIQGQFEVFKALVAVSEGIVNGFKDFFGISSPSTVMAGVGMNMAEGVASGYSQGFAQFAKQATNQMGQFSGAMQGAAAGTFSGGAMTGSAIAGGGGVRLEVARIIGNRQAARWIKQNAPGLVTSMINQIREPGRFDPTTRNQGVTIGNIIVPEGTSREQIDFIVKEIARRTQTRGL
jgi:hypothetical protein